MRSVRSCHGARAGPASRVSLKRIRLIENLLRDILQDPALLNAEIEAMHRPWDGETVQHMKLCAQDAFLWSELCCSLPMCQFVQKTQSLALLQDATSRLQKCLPHAAQTIDEELVSDDDWVTIVVQEENEIE